MVHALHVLQLKTFGLICVTVNIEYVLLWFDCRHGEVCATDRAMVSSKRAVPLQPTHQRRLKSFTSCSFVVWIPCWIMPICTLCAGKKV